MKPGELKRYLLVFLGFSIVIGFYLYWQQSADIISEKLIFSYRHLRADRLKKSDRPPQWTWQCINQRCERRHLTATIPTVSLQTCSMLCGSTQLWPQPTGRVTLGSRPSPIHQIDIETNAQAPARALLLQAFAHFNDTIANLIETPSPPPPPPNPKKLLVSVQICDSSLIQLQLATNESYTLLIKSHHQPTIGIVATITAPNFFGARHGLETLSQLIWWDEIGESLQVLKAALHDTPAFPYRGIMVDTARNFMSIDSLKKVIIGMAANKLNVFHWHVSDSQSFPLVLPQVPQLAASGAYAPHLVYTPEEVRAFVEFARVHGVRVYIEVDTPAHAGNGWTWGAAAGLGELALCVNERPWVLYCGEPPCGQLNPDNANVYDILEKVYSDLLELTGERELFHIGGDEVNLDCWAQHLQKTTALQNYTDLHDLWGDFTLKAMRRLTMANGNVRVPQVIVWSSNLSKRPYIGKYFDKKEVVVQSWGASQWPDTPDLIADGYRVIISHVDAWYLDCGFGRWRETGDAACDPYRPWQTVYNHRPWQQLRLNKKQILGGEACVWSEQYDEAALDGRLWPRAAAFAERVWSDPQLDLNTLAIQEDVYTRLNTQRGRLRGRGLAAAAIWPLWCTQNPGMCL